MFLTVGLTPEETMTHCNLHDKMHNTKVLMCISKGAHELKEEGDS